MSRQAAGGVRGITTDEFAFVRSITARTPKVTMPTPSLVHFLRGDQTVSRAAYPDLDEFWADLIAIYQRGAARPRPRSAAATCSSTKCPARCCAIRRCAPRSQSRGVDPGALLDTYIWAVNQVTGSRARPG